MRKIYKIEEKLTSEGTELRQPVAELEAPAAEREQAEEKLQTILKTALDGFWLINLEGKLLEVNDSYCKMIGYTREELLKMSISDLEAIESPGEVAQRIAKIIEQGSDHFESQHKRKDSKIINVEISVNYLDVGEGQFFVFARDITERKKAEEALRESEYYLRKAQQTAHFGSWVWDVRTNRVEFSDEMFNIFGITKEQFVGTPKYTNNLITPKDRARVQECNEDLLIRHKPTSMEYSIIRPDGSVRHLWGNGEVELDEKSNLQRLVGTVLDITERKQVEEALRDSEEKLRKMFESVTDSISVIDLNGVITEVNQRTVEMHGYNSKAELLGKSAVELVAPRDHEKVAKSMREAIKRGAIRDVEYTLLKSDGSEFPAELSTSVLKDASGNPVGHITISRDITERKQVEEALQAEKNKLQSVTDAIDAMEDGLSMQDTDYNIIYQNEPLRTRQGDHLGEKCYRAYEGQEKVCDGCPAEKAFKDGKSHTAERRVVMPSGEVTFWEVTANLTRDATGSIVSCIEIGRNITERKQAEEALRESEDFSSSLLTNSPNPMLVINQDTSVRYVNPALEKLTGFSPKEVIGRKAPYPWWTEETLKKTAKDLDQAMRHGAKRLEELFQKKNGELFWVEITSTPVTSNGEFKYYLANWVDITERKQAEEREKELQQELYHSSRLAAIGELAAGIAHQINNPLTGVLGFSQRLLRKSTDPKVSQDLKRIYTEAARAAKVVQNLLTFARRRQPHKQFSDINEILESALELRAYELKTSNIEVVTELAPNLPQIMLDFHQIQEVFLNIILNAEQAMTEAHSGGRLTIKTEEKKGYIRTTFTDDGPGIPEEHLDRIFDPFFTTKGERGGTGLGLSVCHGIITEHGGWIYAKSKPGKGAAFFVELSVIANTSQEVAVPEGDQVVTNVD